MTAPQNDLDMRRPGARRSAIDPDLLVLAAVVAGVIALFAHLVVALGRAL